MEQEQESNAIVGRPTMMAIFDGHRETQPILDALRGAGYPLDDIDVLLRPAGTDAVEDLRTGERPAGQSGDARLLGDKGSKTLVLLHPEPGQVDAVQAALNTLGAEKIEYEAQTFYTGAQSEEDAAAEAIALAPQLREETAHDRAQAEQNAAQQAAKKPDQTKKPDESK